MRGILAGLILGIGAGGGGAGGGGGADGGGARGGGGRGRARAPRAGPGRRSGAGGPYFSDTGNHCVRRVDRAGTITTVAGTGTKGFSGDGGPATQAQLNEHYGIALDADENLFIVDRLNARVRRVDARTGVISTV